MKAGNRFYSNEYSSFIFIPVIWGLCVERPRKKYSVLTSPFIQTNFHGLLLRHSLFYTSPFIWSRNSAQSVQSNTIHVVIYFFKIYIVIIIPVILRPSKLPYTSNVQAKIACFGMVPERVLNVTYILPIL